MSAREQAISTPTAMERDAAVTIDAPDGETPRYGLHATLTYLDPEGWYVIWGNEVHPYGANYPDALAAWGRVEGKTPSRAEGHNRTTDSDADHVYLTAVSTVPNGSKGVPAAPGIRVRVVTGTANANVAIIEAHRSTPAETDWALICLAGEYLATVDPGNQWADVRFHGSLRDAVTAADHRLDELLGH